MKIIMLSVFVLVTAIHLYASLKKNKKLRNITKPFILLSLTLWYVLTVDKINILLVLALIFSWIGDLLLIGVGIKYFVAGGISFWIGHALFVASYIEDINFSKINPVIIVVLALIFTILTINIFRKLKEHLPHNLFYPMATYLLVNGTMNCFAIFRMLSNVCLPTIITAIGAFLFFISDATLFFVRFKKDSRIKTHFPVMFTYSIGELLIVLGMIRNIF